MDAQLKAKWVEALRSGEYRQTQGRLCDGDGFCCLGVLCDVTKRGEWVEASSSYRPGSQRYKIGEHYSTIYLPRVLQSEFALSEDDMAALMDMNDSGRPFPVIADHIEANL